MRCMPKNTCVVKTDRESSSKYVAKNIDELTKNHRADYKEMLSAMMPEQPDISLCPVRSFEKNIFLSYIRFAIAFGKDRCNPLWRTLMSGIAILLSVVTC